MYPPSAADSWRLLTPQNIQVKRIWPWSYSIQKFIDLGEPRPRHGGNLLVASDYGGEHSKATHNIYCFLVVRAGASAWLSTISSVRRSYLSDGRTMSYKGLSDIQRQKALVPFLRAAANLDGHLVAIAVDKRKKWLTTFPGSTKGMCEAFELKASWNPRSFESMIRKTHFLAIFLSIWAKPFTNVHWITDHDEFVANDIRHDDALLTVARMTSFYVSHPMGIFRLNTTNQNKDIEEFEDFCSIPDLAAGMLSEVSTRLSKVDVWEDKLRRKITDPLSFKADVIADWFWDEKMKLRKSLISVDIEGEQYGVRKIWMLS